MPSTSKCNWPNQPNAKTLAVLQHRRICRYAPARCHHSLSFVSDCAFSPLRVSPLLIYSRLPLHLVGLVTLSQAEGAAEVATEVLDLLDVGDQRLVDSLLVRSAGAGDLLLLGLLSLLEESFLASLLLSLIGSEVLGLGDLVDLLAVETSNVDLEGGGDDVAGVDPAQGNAVDLEGAGDEEDTLVEGLQEDDALAAEAAGEEDEDGAGLQRLAGSPRADSLANLFIPIPLAKKSPGIRVQRLIVVVSRFDDGVLLVCWGLCSVDRCPMTFWGRVVESV
jgi:hypothetical protein